MRITPHSPAEHPLIFRTSIVQGLRELPHLVSLPIREAFSIALTAQILLPSCGQWAFRRGSEPHGEQENAVVSAAQFWRVDCLCDVRVAAGCDEQVAVASKAILSDRAFGGVIQQWKR